MARRNRTSLADDLIGLTARLPWWVGVLLALLSYVGLRAVAQPSLPPAVLPGQWGAFAVSGLWRALAMIGQYLLPFLFLLGAAISAFRRRRAARLHAAAQRADGMARMSWQEFELLVGEYFRRQGYGVTDNGGGGPDGGVDVLLKKSGQRYLVQCKHWRALSVGVQPVRELYGVMAAQGVTAGFVVTSGSFTEEAREFAHGLALELIDGRALQRGIRAQAAPLAPASRPRQAPDCPQCGAAMVLRQARSGPTPGKEFWGCSRYAQARCRGTREVD
ncbi:MAG: restriction endonuclease [Pseudomonadota bacterium]|nr:restriction endonuclease [Pseudomonadota bacterium]